jgi:hypothetical protein
MGVWTLVGGIPPLDTTLNGDGFTYIGIFNDSTELTFTTEGGPNQPFSSVPEPVTMLLVGSGLAGGWFVRRRATKA